MRCHALSRPSAAPVAGWFTPATGTLLHKLALTGLTAAEAATRPARLVRFAHSIETSPPRSASARSQPASRAFRAAFQCGVSVSSAARLRLPLLPLLAIGHCHCRRDSMRASDCLRLGCPAADQQLQQRFSFNLFPPATAVSSRLDPGLPHKHDQCARTFRSARPEPDGRPAAPVPSPLLLLLRPPFLPWFERALAGLPCRGAGAVLLSRPSLRLRSAASAVDCRCRLPIDRSWVIITGPVRRASS